MRQPRPFPETEVWQVVAAHGPVQAPETTEDKMRHRIEGEPLDRQAMTFDLRQGERELRRVPTMLMSSRIRICEGAHVLISHAHGYNTPYICGLAPSNPVYPWPPEGGDADAD